VTRRPDAHGTITISGKTYPEARVTLDPPGDGAPEQTVKADAQGDYTFTFQVGFGKTRVRIDAEAPPPAAAMLPISTTLIVNRPRLVVPSGTSGSPETQSQGGSQLPANSALASAIDGWGRARFAVDNSLLLDGGNSFGWI
jgi:hypothetical protein